MTARRLALTLLLGATAIGGIGALGARALLHRAPVRDALIRRAIDRNLATAAARRAMLDDKTLRVLLCGTASPMPNRERAGPCAAILAGGRIWLVDAGGGGWRNLMLWQFPGDRLAAVLLTHFHSDHIQDLGEVNLQSWVAGRTAPLRVFGGPGVERVAAGFTEAYALDATYRVAHHGADYLPPAAARLDPHAVTSAGGAVLHEGETVTVLAEDGVKIEAIGVNHAPVSPAYAYRFTYGGRSVTVSGDTKASPAFATAAAGTDVLVHEAQEPGAVAAARDAMAANSQPRLAKLLTDIQTYHASPADAARIANAANARLLVLTHLTPPLPGFIGRPAFLDGAMAERPTGTVLGADGMLIALPPNTETVSVGAVD